MENAAIAEQFSLLSKLLDIHGEDPNKARSYSIAAFQIDRLEQQLSADDLSPLNGIRGIGSSIRAKVSEWLETGRIQELEDLLKTTPVSIIEMLQIKGLGPKKIHTVWKEMGISSIGELEYACNENRLERYKGFGPKTQTNVLEAIRFYNQNLGHFLYAQIEAIYPQILAYLQQLFGTDQVLGTGDFRRQLLTIKELEFIVQADAALIQKKFQSQYPPELVEENSDSLLYKLNNGLKLRLYITTGNKWAAQFLKTASMDFIDAFMGDNDRAGFDIRNFESEEAIFREAELPYIPPFLRENREIITRARAGELPQVIQLTDIRGMIHNHSNWSDGQHTIEQLSQDLMKKGFEYLVISDHSRSAAYANGLTEERVLAQQAFIDQYNLEIAPFKIFKSIESDILNDGRLDYSDEILKTFDLVIASVHSNLAMNETKAMQRLITAIENPYTTILGHPTGRLLLSRNGYPLDHEKIIDACAANRVVIEINANPHRLDLDWKWIDYALNKGVLLSINPDAHSIEGLYDVKYGIWAAQKGGLIAPSNLSSFSLKELETYLLNTKAAKQ
ncbi:helix-hairpin-helix domain-containing protein [Niabella terrae]